MLVLNNTDTVLIFSLFFYLSYYYLCYQKVSFVFVHALCRVDKCWPPIHWRFIHHRIRWPPVTQTISCNDWGIVWIRRGGEMVLVQLRWDCWLLILEFLHSQQSPLASIAHYDCYYYFLPILIVVVIIDSRYLRAMIGIISRMTSSNEVMWCLLLLVRRFVIWILRPHRNTTLRYEGDCSCCGCWWYL